MTTKTTTTAKTAATKHEGFTEDERSAMKARAKELKAESRRSAKDADAENEVLAKIAEMSDSDRVIAEKLHAVIKASAPVLTAKLWYGMPAYARDGKIVCFFQCAAKFKTRYGMLGFSDEARLDDGAVWPAYYAITSLNAADEARIGAIVKQAVS